MTGTLAVTLNQAAVRDIPVLRVITPYASPRGLIGPFQNGDARGTLARGVFRLERLAPHFDGQQIDGNIHIIEPGANNGGEIKHLGQEIGYLLEGQIELVIGDQSYHLSEGDSFFFKSDLPHSYRNVSRKLARIIWINTPPTF